jgi:hypothetical protein
MDKIVRKTGWLAALALGLLSGCAPIVDGDDQTDYTDSALHADDDPLTSGESEILRSDRMYRVEISAAEVEPDLDLDAPLRPAPDLFATVQDARTVQCTDTWNCNFDLEQVNRGRLFLPSGEERLFSGRELRDGASFRVITVERPESSGGFEFADGIVETVRSLTRFRIGRCNGSWSADPLGDTKKISIRVRC